MMKSALRSVGIGFIAAAGLASAHNEAPTCPTTEPIQAQPPDDPNADAFGYSLWQINGDRTLWATWGADRLKAGRKANKVLWIRPAGAQLTVSGRRLDASAPPMKATIPCCYPTGYQASGLTFPSEGCWQVDAAAGTSKLTFITAVAPEGKRR
jgi:hypothetical protein